MAPRRGARRSARRRPAGSAARDAPTRVHLDAVHAGFSREVIHHGCSHASYAVRHTVGGVCGGRIVAPRTLGGTPRPRLAGARTAPRLSRQAFARYASSFSRGAFARAQWVGRCLAVPTYPPTRLQVPTHTYLPTCRAEGGPSRGAAEARPCCHGCAVLRVAPAVQPRRRRYAPRLHGLRQRVPSSVRSHVRWAGRQQPVRARSGSFGRCFRLSQGCGHAGRAAA